ncbi:MAG: glutamate dehydrogenase, partial [Prolixibacteraceae bacterium]|nr:glutamate dehydrogenase [Prolixibacteraceae bacterium]
LDEIKKPMKGLTVAVSGFGNVAWGAICKIDEMGGKVVTISGPDGYIYDEKGISGEKIEYLLDLRATNNDVVEPYAAEFGATFYAGKRPWEQAVNVAIPCACENELNEDDAMKLVQNGCFMVAEASNMGCTASAVDYLNSKIIYAPGKAVNAGGVAVSGLEMSQNSMRYSWTRDEVDKRLHIIMGEIHASCKKYGTQNGKINYLLGANIGGFVKVADAMLAQGVV